VSVHGMENVFPAIGNWSLADINDFNCQVFMLGYEDHFSSSKVIAGQIVRVGDNDRTVGRIPETTQRFFRPRANKTS
jgi:hypothetical protein